MGDIVRRVKNGKFIGWSVRYKDSDGQRRIRASHQPTRELARRYLVEIEARIARGLVGIPEQASPPPTVVALTERFLAEYSRPRIKDLALYRLHARKNLRRVLPLLGTRPADAVRPEEVARVRDTMGRKYSAASVRTSLAFLAAAYAWAVRQGIVKGNPLHGVERPAAQSSLDFLGRNEVNTVLRVATERASTGLLRHQRLSCCIQLALYTGLRKGELLGLRWPDLDLDTQRLTVARSYQVLPKSGKARHLRLPSACVPALRAWQAVCPPTPQALVFPLPGSGARPERSLLGLTRLLTAAGVRVPAHPWHAMRHTFASHFIMAGGNILTLQRILGHSDVKMTLIYAHLAPDFLGQEMERIQYG
jgi:integrase